MYGPSGVRDNLTAIVVSEVGPLSFKRAVSLTSVLCPAKETAKGGPMVNAKRKENGVGPLDIVIVKLVSYAPLHTPCTAVFVLRSVWVGQACA